MGNQESQRPVNKLDQRIQEASYVTRDVKSGGSASYLPFDHAGILVKTDTNQQYIIHHTGPKGDVRTESYDNVKYQDWKSEGKIEVNSHKTIREAEAIGGKGQGYWSNGTCIGVAHKIKSGLQSG